MKSFWPFKRPQAEREPSCHEVRESASAYLEKELPASFAQRFRYHLERCPNCNAFVATLRATISALRGLPKAQPSEGLKERIRQQATQQNDKPIGGHQP